MHKKIPKPGDLFEENVFGEKNYFLYLQKVESNTVYPNKIYDFKRKKIEHYTNSFFKYVEKISGA